MHPMVAVTEKIELTTERTALLTDQLWGTSLFHFDPASLPQQSHATVRERIVDALC
jgi:hypothetical protein